MKLKPVGYFSKPHGLKGHLILFTSCDLKNKINAFFIRQKGSEAPYFIEELKPHASGFLVKLESVDDVNAASVLKNKEVLAEEKFVIEEEEFEFLNYTLIDELKGEVGIIEGMEGNSNNPLLKIISGEKEILLPFNEDLVIKIVKTKKQLFYKAPEGLIDMYLEE
jgi:16S rRNA processing protein RimM